MQDIEIGAIVGGYRIDGAVGRGQMSTVYIAHSPDLPRHDALKVANDAVVSDDALRARFIREADVGATLTHPNIVTIHRRGLDGDLLWIAMQYVPGGDVEAALQSGTITAARAVDIIADIAEALDYAHSQGVIHRDVKPANFLIAADGRGLLGDFGVAHRVGTDDDPPNSVAATLAYAAPEVLTCQPFDGRADVYSLGCSLYRLLTGRTPFPFTADTAAMIAHHLNDPAPTVSAAAPEIPAAMDAVIARALAKTPDDRYPTARALARAAKEALRGVDLAPLPVPPPVRPMPTAAQQHRPTHDDAPTPALVPFDIPRPTLSTATPPPDTDNARLLRIGGAVLAAAGVAAGATIWLTSGGEPAHSADPTTPASANPSPTPTPPPTPTRSPAAEAQLLRDLPPGYPTGACRAVPPTDGAQAAAECMVIPGPDQPTVTVTHWLMPNQAALSEAFDHLLSTASVVLCPGNVPIQSPGPWRRNATPDQIAGTLACGFQRDRPVVAWTTDASLRISAVTAPSTGQDILDSIYAWWTMHS